MMAQSRSGLKQAGRDSSANAEIAAYMEGVLRLHRPILPTNAQPCTHNIVQQVASI